MRLFRTLSVLVLSIFALTACIPPGTVIDCEWERRYPTAEGVAFTDLMACTQSYHYVFNGMRSLSDDPFMSTAANFDASQLSIDLSKTNVPLASSNGYITLSLEMTDGRQESKSFEWVRFGSLAVFSNPGEVNQWFVPRFDDLSAIKAFFNFGVEEKEGFNLVVSELLYGRALLAGASTSWYVNPSDQCGPGRSCETK